MRSIAVTVAVAVLLPLSASAEEMIIMLGTIPNDTREVIGAPDKNGVSPLKRFKHLPHLVGSSIAMLPGERMLVVADTDNNAVVVVDSATRAAIRTIAVGRRPERLVVSPDGRVFVTNRGSRSVSIVDPIKGRELRSVSAGVEPYGIALSPGGDTLLVTSSATSELLGFDARTLSLRFTLPLKSAWPAAVTFHPDGKRAFVTHMHGRDVDVVSLDSRTVTDTLQLPDRGTGTPGRLMGRGEQKRFANLAFSAVVSPGGNRLFVAHTMVDTGANRSASLGRGGGYGLGGQSPIVATVSTFDLKTGKLLRPKVDFNSNSTKGFSHLSQADQQVQQLAQPMALAHDPRHARLVMVAMGSDRIMSLNTLSSDPISHPIASRFVGQAPKGIVFTADGSKAFVHNAHSYSVSPVDFAAQLPKEGDARRWTVKSGASAVFARNPLPETAARGRRAFTFALDPRVGGANRFACASCHPDGRHDGMVWQIGAGPRQTPILAGRLFGTGPFNWLGTEDKLHENVKQTVRRLGGTGCTDQQLDDMTEYLSRYLPGLDNPNRGHDVAELAMGRELFHDAEVGCSSCHDSTTRFTDGANHEVGTTTKLEADLWARFGKPKNAKPKTRGKRPGGPRARVPPPAPGGRFNPMGGITEPIPEAPVAYNTPGLQHLWASAPYYHHGGSKSLEHLLTAGNAGDRMGKTSHLTAVQLKALVAYLKTL